MDIKTYTTTEAKIEWDGSSEGKRRMFLARINMRDSDIAMRPWAEINLIDRKMLHSALNEDFVSPIWYINTKGQRINKVHVAVVQKTQEQLDDEAAKQLWEDMRHEERFSVLLQHGIGRDAEQGKYSTWDSLAPDLRGLLVKHFSFKTT